MECRVTGNLVAFIEYIKDQYSFAKSPPACLYAPLDPQEFILVVHQILDDILHPPAKTGDLSAVEVLDEESEPKECLDNSPVVTQDVDRRDNIESSLTSIDLDLYGQPFALEPPSPPLFPLTPLFEDISESFFPSVGTSTLQPISISEMSTDPSTFVFGDPSSSNTKGTPATARDRAGVTDEGNDGVDGDKEEEED